MFESSPLIMQNIGVKTKTCWHRNIEVSKDWGFSRLTTPRFAKRDKYIRVCEKSNKTGVTCSAGTAYHSESSLFAHGF